MLCVETWAEYILIWHMTIIILALLFARKYLQYLLLFVSSKQNSFASVKIFALLWAGIGVGGGMRSVARLCPAAAASVPSCRWRILEPGDRYYSATRPLYIIILASSHHIVSTATLLYLDTATTGNWCTYTGDCTQPLSIWLMSGDGQSLISGEPWENLALVDQIYLIQIFTVFETNQFLSIFCNTK